jgi:hypothetical protein
VRAAIYIFENDDNKIPNELTLGSRQIRINKGNQNGERIDINS